MVVWKFNLLKGYQNGDEKMTKPVGQAMRKFDGKKKKKLTVGQAMRDFKNYQQKSRRSKNEKVYRNN